MTFSEKDPSLTGQTYTCSLRKQDIECLAVLPLWVTFLFRLQEMHLAKTLPPVPPPHLVLLRSGPYFNVNMYGLARALEVRGVCMCVNFILFYFSSQLRMETCHPAIPTSFLSLFLQSPLEERRWWEKHTHRINRLSLQNAGSLLSCKLAVI